MNTMHKLLSLLCVTVLLASCQTGSPQTPLSEQPTPDLVLKHRQLSDRISTPLPARGGDVNVTVNTGKPKSAFAQGFEDGARMAQQRRADQPYVQREGDLANKEHIERELFRRWQSGDTAAELPMFKGLKP